MLNQNKLVVGTLTGGVSDCSPLIRGTDFYGRYSKHWNSFGNNSNERIDSWLDPISSNKTFLRSIKYSQCNLSSVLNSSVTNLPIVFFDSEVVNISFLKPFRYSIYNLIGKQLIVGYSDADIVSINLSSFPPSIYFVEVSKSGLNYMNKIQK